MQVPNQREPRIRKACCHWDAELQAPVAAPEVMRSGSRYIAAMSTFVAELISPEKCK